MYIAHKELNLKEPVPNICYTDTKTSVVFGVNAINYFNSNRPAK